MKFAFVNAHFFPYCRLYLTNEVLDCIFDYPCTAEKTARCMGTDFNRVALKIAHLAYLNFQSYSAEAS